jgi:predicted nucleic-acid-binding protein
MFTKQEIIDEVIEKLLLMLPDIMGNLITNHISMLEMNKDFYLKHPELRNKKDIVASVIEMIEGQDPTVDYKDILRNALPEIEKRIKQVKDTDFNPVSKPNRLLKDLTFDNGEL